MGGTAGAGYNDPETGRFRAPGEGIQPVGGAVRRDDLLSQGIPRAASVSAAWRMVSQSDWLPMIMATGVVIRSILFGNPKT